MLDPSEIDFKKLPSVSIEDRRQLPESSCIYFAIDSQDKIQYIGRTSNAKQRWQNHHRCEQLVQIGGVRIVYLVISEPSLLPAIELALIKYFSPFLNDLTVLDRTDAALEALKVKRAIPDGWKRSQLAVWVPNELVEWYENATPIERGRVLMAGMKAIAQVENLRENK